MPDRPSDLTALLSAAPSQHQPLLDSLGADGQRRLIGQLSAQDYVQLMHILSEEQCADLLEAVAPAQAVEILRALPTDLQADLMEAVPAPLSRQLMGELGQEDSQGILQEIEDNEKARILEQRLTYPTGSAGALMRWYALSYEETTTVRTFLDEIRQKKEVYNDEDFQYFYTIDAQGALTGVINSRSLLLAEESTLLSEIKIHSPYTVLDTTPLEVLDDVIEDKHYLSFPVVDAQQRFLGVVGRDAILDAVTEREADQFLKSKGVVGGEELRSMPLLSRGLKRLSWLAPNIGLNMIGAGVISLFQETLTEVILLAVFLPVVSNMCGCSGSQAIAVSIRELTLGIVTPRDVWQVVRKEILVGMPSGLLLGCLLGLISGIWAQSWIFGAVIGVSLFLNTVVSVIIGGGLPLILKRLKIDPALASSPILTTCTDLCGFFFILSLATMTLEKL